MSREIGQVQLEMAIDFQTIARIMAEEETPVWTWELPTAEPNPYITVAVFTRSSSGGYWIVCIDRIEERYTFEHFGTATQVKEEARRLLEKAALATRACVAELVEEARL